jgi:hypothetical protein|tara:strand:+ start:17883 stop:18185 length:303 start_codon:yes stop_codon:yes gene_type:complete
MVTTITSTVAIMVLGYMIYDNHKLNKRLDYLDIKLMDLDDAIERESKHLDDADELIHVKINKTHLDNNTQMKNLQNIIRNQGDKITRLEGLLNDSNWKSY